MAIVFKRCVTEDEQAETSLFLLARRRDLDRSFETLDAVTLLYRYFTQGELHYGADENGQVVGALGMYIGTPEEEFADRYVAFVDMIVLDPARAGSRTFLSFLSYMAGYMERTHPGTTRARFVAQSHNAYLRRLYEKLARPIGTRDDANGQVTIYSEEISRIGDVLSRYHPV